jgi:hypothetical protein
MHKLFLVLLMLASPAFAQKKINKEITCYATEAALRILLEEFEEKPVWMGKTDNDKNNYMLLVNSSTQTWTLLQLNRDASCIIGTGEKFSFKSIKGPSV